ncbi:MAG TPA: hypothetical protein VN285_13320 [Candidatus Deferrimicrobium sp.]|nr:hypothetical protein [Candidatus Deferrimicrobium sp.]
MYYLGDIIGYLLSECTIARARADSESLRIAELYASDSFLRHFPVPRFRTPTITIELPVAISKLELDGTADINHGKIDMARSRTAFFKILFDTMTSVNVKLPQKLMDSVRKELTREFDILKRSPEYVIDTKTLVKQLVSRTVQELRHALPGIEESVLQELTKRLGERCYRTFVRFRQLPPRLMVLATSQELREVGDTITRIHLTVSEEAVEWTVIESEGKSVDRLVPE